MNQAKPVDKEYHFEGRVIISETDLKGKITYANRKFCEIAGYTKDELIGQPHSIIRHPDMPKAAFQNLWDTIQHGKTWTGAVKNLRKDGRYYWVDTTITPNLDDSGATIGYSAARRTLNDLAKERAIEKYKKMLQNETKES